MSDLLPVPQPPSGPPDHQGYASYGSATDQGSPASAVRLRRLITFLLRFWWIPILTSALSLAGAVTYALLAPPTYVSSARMWEAEKMRLPGGAAFDEDNQTYYGTQTELLQSTRLTQLTLDNLGTTHTNAIPKDKSGKPPKVYIKVKQQPKSTVLLLEATSANAAYTQAYLESLMAVFQVYRKDVRNSVSGSTFSSISEQIKRLESQLAEDQKAFNQFQKTNNLAVLQEEANQFGGYLARLKTQLSDLQLEAKILDASFAEQESASSGSTNAVPYLLDSLRSTGTGGSSAFGGADRQLAFKELELLKAQREKLSRVYKPKHPKIVKLDADIERGQKLAELYRNQTRDQLSSAQQAVKIRTDTVVASIQEWEGKMVDSKARIAEADRLRQNIARSQGLYERLLVLLENVDIGRNINQETLSVLDEATPAERSYKESIALLVVGALLGFGVGLGIVSLMEIRDDRFTSMTEVTARFGDSIVGHVPEVQDVEPNVANGSLGSADGQHLLAESYRSLRSALFFLPMETNRPKVILVTSAVPHEGKSTITANLARTIALGGARVLLVDGDLRKGRLHERFGLNSQPGLVELLGATESAERIVQRNCLPNLSFIGRGSSHGYPGDLLLSPALDQLLARWREQFDYVLIDSCPVFAAADVATLAPKADGILFVVSRGYSSARVVREALELLLQRGAKILGLVFNRADASRPSYYYYKYAEYYGGKAAKGEEQGAKG